MREVHLSLRGKHEGKNDAFIDHAAEGVECWVSGARSGVVRWGFMVLKKHVSMRHERYSTDAMFGGASSRLYVLTKMIVYLVVVITLPLVMVVIKPVW